MIGQMLVSSLLSVSAVLYEPMATRVADAHAGDAASNTLDREAVVADLARCLVERDRVAAQKTVLAIDSAPLKAFVEGKSFKTCTQSADRTTLSTAGIRRFEVAFGVAEVLLDDTSADDGTSFGDEIAPLHVGAPGKPGEMGWRSAKNIVYAVPLSPTGECIVRHDPIASLALIRSSAGSERDIAFETLKSAIAACSGPNGVMATDPYFIRGTVAVNFYRLLSEKSGKKA